MAFESRLEELVNSLYDIGALKFGDFTLKSGIKSPIYCDLRLLVSYPELLKFTSELMIELLNSKNINYQNVCGVPIGAIPLATAISLNTNKPMILKRKDVKNYGTKKAIEGVFKENDVSLVVEDVSTSGSSIVETYESLKEHGLVVNDAIVILDRQQNAFDTIQTKNGVNFHSLLTLTSALDVLYKNQKISQDIYNQTLNFINESQTKVVSQ